MIFDCRPGVRRLAGGFSSPLVTSALTWLYSVQQFGIKPGLANTRRLLRELALPGARQKFLHVAGTNGKGSTCAFIESILRTAGERTGLFTSPHLVSFCERMRCGGRMIELEEAEQGIEALRAVVSGWDPHPTFFELTMALALDWMDRSGAEVVVLETGMGGRLDATNALTPLVSVITPIAMDHQQWLGNSIAEIAAEKAGIIKAGIPVVSAPQHPAAAEVIRAAAEYSGSALTVVEEPWPGPLPLAGEHQRWNAAVAVAAVREAGFRLPHEILVRGLAATAWPGRFQMLPGRRVVLDGSHNPHGTEATVATWKQEFPGQRATVIFGAVEAKDFARSLRLLSQIAARYFLVTLQSPRAVPASEVAKSVPGEYETLEFTELEEALQAAAKCREPVLVTGSLYLCGEVLGLQSGGNFEASSQ
jgi:dihydrofolate synthase/folylpolyglutamate synthase